MIEITGGEVRTRGLDISRQTGDPRFGRESQKKSQRTTYISTEQRIKILGEKHNYKQHQNRITTPQRQPPRPSNAQFTFTDKPTIDQTDTQRWIMHRKTTTHSTSARQIIAGNGHADFASIANNRIQMDRDNRPTETQTTEAA